MPKTLRDRYEESLISLGFSQESAEYASSLLAFTPDWNHQFETGKTKGKLPRENKTTIAPSLPGMDIDNRPGKQKGDQGKQKDQSSLAISPTAVAGGNPQQGPRSRSDLKGFAMFDESSPSDLTGQCNQAEKRKQRQAQRTPEEKLADAQRSKDMAGQAVAPSANRDQAAKKAAETRKKCKTGTSKSPSTVPTTNPSGAGTGASGMGAGGGAGSGAAG